MKTPPFDDRRSRLIIALALAGLLFAVLALFVALSAGSTADAHRSGCIGRGHWHAKYHCVPYTPGGQPGGGVINPAKSKAPTVKAPVPPRVPAAPRISVRKR